MTYSCSDFTDSILDALKIEVPDEHRDNPSHQADLALAAIERLHAVQAAPIRPAQLIVAIFETRHGDEVKLFPSCDGAMAWRQQIAAENWSARMDEEKPADAQEAADAYFERVGEMRGDFFRAEECTIEGTAPAWEWRSIARDLAGALSSCTDQIGQMRGMFDDKDGAIQDAVDDADKAMTDYTAAINASPAAPAPGPVVDLIWTCTTEGDNCQLTTTVHATQAEAFERVRDDLIADCKPTQLAHLQAMPAADLPGAWEDKNDGPCMIESHPARDAQPVTAAEEAKAWAALAEAHRDAMRANLTIVKDTPDELLARAADGVVSALERYAAITPASA